MRLRRSFRNPIDGKDWSIKTVKHCRNPDTKELSYGYVDYDKHRIVLEHSLQGVDLIDILLHELWHAVGEKNGSHRVRRNIHTITGELAQMMYALGFRVTL